MQKVAVSTLHTLISMHANLDEGEEMVSPIVIASQFADWTDPRKVFGAIRPGKESLVNQDVHTDLAFDIFTKLGASGNSQFLLVPSPVSPSFDLSVPNRLLLCCFSPLY